MTYTFTIPIEPRGKMAIRAVSIGGKAMAFPHPEQAKYATKVRAIIESLDRPTEPLTGPLMLSVDVMLPIPASWSKRKRDEAIAGYIRPTSKPDVSNLLKNIEDIMNGLIWVDDKQIVGARIVKSYNALPGWLVTVQTIEDRVSDGQPD